MRHLPKCIPELDGGLFLPRPVVELLEAVLQSHEAALCHAAASGTDTELDLTVLAELRQLLRLTGLRLPLPPAHELLGLADPQEARVARNLLRLRPLG
jgi:hypothetical protein